MPRGKQPEKKRKRSRKARTEVSSDSLSSSSSSDSESASPPRPKRKQSQPNESQHSQPQQTAAGSESEGIPNDHDEASEPEVQQTKPVSAEQAFDDFYLQQTTREFANELDKLRAAGDFREDSSLPVLIAALKQGRECFSPAERRRIVGR